MTTIAEHRSDVSAMMRLMHATPEELWLTYFADSGDASEHEVEEWLYGVRELPLPQVDLLGVAVNDLAEEHGLQTRVGDIAERSAAFLAGEA
ncbi:hypothetical protein [Arthrobacter burdickii]|uniref:Uncharacterized protein n=1 Tax=Arthrobacter burdickii TaxID=3035920 RepID=A0ABT8K1Q3_9MICC|nr:hypothetical protein [Arthrobacter burdickii]MDN4611346.1 hypothetical protein [Arthrobacter burdickii]